MTMDLAQLPDRIRANPRYYGDHLIRHYRLLGLAAYHADHGTSGDLVTIAGGIGTLTMHADGREDWKPTLPDAPRQPAPAPLPADATLAAARRAVCASCDSMRDGRCSAAGCGCAGEAQPDVLSSRCPLGRWPQSAPSAPSLGIQPS